MMEVYSYGGAATLRIVFNAVAQFTNSTAMNSVLLIAAALVTIGSVFKVMEGQNALKSNVSMVGLVVLISSGIIGLKQDVLIVDAVSKQKFKVDNVPMGLAMPASMISSILYKMNSSFEAIYATANPRYRTYEKNGLLFGSEILSNLPKMDVTNTNLKKSMSDFAYQCVFLGSQISTTHGIDTLRNSTDIWQLAKTKFKSRLRFFTYHYYATGQKIIVSCHQGFQLIEADWTIEAPKMAAKYGKINKPNLNSTAAKMQFLKDLPIVYSTMLGASKSANDMLRQSVMINALQDGGANRSTSQSARDNFLSSRIAIADRMKNQAFWVVAPRKLIAMFNILTAMLYAFFPVVVILLLFNKASHFFTYLQTLMAISMIPMYWTVVNLFYNNSENNMYGEVGPLSFNNQFQYVDSYLSMTATGGMTAFGAIPFILLIFKGMSGLQSMVSAQAMHGSGTATSTGSEMASGNISQGAVAYNTQSAYSQNQNQSNLGGSFDNATSARDIYGGMTTTSALGNSSVQGMQSGGAFSMGLNKSITGSISEEHSKSAQNTLSQASAMDNFMRNDKSFTESLGKSENTDHSKSISNYQSKADDISKSTGISTEALARMSASVGAKIPLTEIGSQLDASYSNASKQDQAAAQKWASSEDTRESYNKAISATKSLSASSGNSEGVNVSNNLSNSIAETKSWSEAERVSQDKSYMKGLNVTDPFYKYAQSQDASFDKSKAAGPSAEAQAYREQYLPGFDKYMANVVKDGIQHGNNHDSPTVRETFNNNQSQVPTMESTVSKDTKTLETEVNTMQGSTDSKIKNTDNDIKNDYQEAKGNMDKNINSNLGHTIIDGADNVIEKIKNPMGK